MVPALLSLALFAFTMLRPGVALAAAATGILQIVNNTGITILVAVEGKDDRNVRHGKKTTFQFNFSSCRKTKKRDFVIKEGPPWQYLLLSEANVVEIKAVRESGSCRAKTSFPEFSDNSYDSYVCTHDDNDDNRTGVVTCESCGSVGCD